MRGLGQGDWPAHFKKLFVYGDNFLHERGGEQYWG